MKTIKIDLDIDCIGGQDKLTKEEERLIAEYFNKRKNKSKLSRSSNKKIVFRKRTKVSI